MAGIKHPVTPDGRYFVVKGKLWRLSDPNIEPREKARLVKALMDALNLKADGIVLKNADPAHLLDCLQTVATGRQWMDPELVDRATTAGAAARTRVALAPRERELIGLVRKGLRNREIASELGVTEGTVKVYLHSIFDKTGVANRTELAMRADALIGPAN